ncbi:MAG TPA: hypothetical protein VF145_08450, partial [Chitinophagaceae bacterium]
MWSQQPVEFINQTEAARIIGILASDSLKGRGNFTKEIEKAALFIAGEFRDMQLNEFEASVGYLQPFVFLEKEEPLEQVEFNGRALASADYYMASPFRFPPQLAKHDFLEKTFDEDVKIGR